MTEDERADDDRVKEAAELNEAKSRLTFDDDTLELDCRKQRCTDAKHNTRVILPGPISPKLERELESRRMDNLTESEAKGLKSLKKRVSEGTLVVCEPEKTGRFAIMNQEEYLEARNHVVKYE